MISFPNQKYITISKQIADIDNIFTTITIDELQHAMRELKKGSALKMWLYFVKNKDGYSFYLSCAEAKRWGISEDSYRDGIKELIQKGYLVECGHNKYLFYSTPKNPISLE